MRSKLFVLIIIALLMTMVLAACGGSSAPEVIEKVVKETVVVETEKVVKETVVVEKEVVKKVVKEVVVTPEPEAAATEPQTGGTLTMSLGPDFVTFDPFFDVNNRQFKPIFFEAPIRISDEGAFEPWLAESWDLVDDGLAYVLHLRKGIKSSLVLRLA